MIPARGLRGRGRGRMGYLEAPELFRWTTMQACGAWPWAVGSPAPTVGVPMGPNLNAAAGGTVGCDPISWFQQGLILNPSEFVLALPAEGKSTLVRHQVLGLHGFGAVPMVLGDLKPDYVDLIKAIGGQILPLGPGRGRINPLDPGEAAGAARRLTGAARLSLLADVHSRRATMVAALLTILRAAPPTDREEAITDRALRVLDDKHKRRKRPPILPDLLRVITEAPEDVRAVAIDRGSIERYREITEQLEASLQGLISGGRLGTVFSGHTTVPMQLGSPVCFDVSDVDDGRPDLQAALLLACWSSGFAAVNAAHALADAGLEPRRHFFLVLDELWRILRAGRGMVDRVDSLTRLNRQEGVGQAMISHTMSDLQALPAEEDRAKARGLVERAGMVILGGLPAAEMPLLSGVVRLTRAERHQLNGWANPAPYDPGTGQRATPPGLGKFLIKVGTHPGIRFRVQLTEIERALALHDTNKLWHEVSRIGSLPAPAAR